MTAADDQHSRRTFWVRGQAEFRSPTAAASAVTERTHGIRFTFARPEPVNASTADAAVAITVAHPRDAESASRPAGIHPTGQSVDERHRLRLSDTGIDIEASTPEGFFRALIRLAQLLTTEPPSRHCVTEAPAYSWRGLSLDVARRFQHPADLERIIDAMALSSLNVLHLHLSDVESWRLQCAAYPRLTEGNEPGQSYSLAQYRHLVAYAAERFITIVPELDLPGHSAAAVAAYPELAGWPDPPHPIVQFVSSRSAPVRSFIETVIAELAAATPGPFLHIGGDEAHGMTHDDYAETVAFVHACAHENEKRVIAWQEASRARVLGPDDILQFWIVEGESFDAEATKRRVPEHLHYLVDRAARTFAQAPTDVVRARADGPAILVSTSTPFYLDKQHAEKTTDHEQSARHERLGMPGYPSPRTRDLGSWDPAAHLRAEFDGLPVAGFEAAVWGESILDFDDAVMLLFPRLGVLAERIWHGTPQAWEDIAAAMRALSRAWNRLGLSAWYRSLDLESAAPTSVMDTSSERNLP